MKKLIARRNETNFRGGSIQIGYDVGWSVWSPLDEKWCEIYWGNTKNQGSFILMVKDAIEQGYEFGLDESAQKLLRGEL